MSVLVNTESKASGNFTKRNKDRVLTRPGELDNRTAMQVNRQRPLGLVIDGGAGKKIESKPFVKREIKPNNRKMDRLEDATLDIHKRQTNFLHKTYADEEVGSIEESIPTVSGPQVEISSIVVKDSTTSHDMTKYEDSETIARSMSSDGVPPISEANVPSSESTAPESTCETTITKKTKPTGELRNLDDLDKLPHVDMPEVHLSEVPPCVRDMVQQQSEDRSKIVFQPIKLLHSLYEREMLSSAEKEFLAMVVNIERVLGNLQDEWLRRRESWNGLGFVPFKGTQLDSSTAYPQSVLSADIWMCEQMCEKIDTELFHSLPRYRPLSIAEERNFQFLVMKSTVEVLRTLLVDLRRHLATSISNMEFIMSNEGANYLERVFLHSNTDDVLLGPDGLLYLSVMENGDKSKMYWMIRSQTPEEKLTSKKYYKDYYDDSCNWIVLQDWIKDWINGHPETLDAKPGPLAVFTTWKDIQKSSYYQVISVKESRRVRIKTKLRRSKV